MRQQARNEESPELGRSLWLPAPGELIANRFLIEALAATGGMGAVFRARDLSNGESVAIKFVRLTRELALERFAREAQVLSELHHPAIVRYITHGPTGRDGMYLAMEWLEGDDLARTLTRVQLSFTQTEPYRVELGIDERLAQQTRRPAGLLEH